MAKVAFLCRVILATSTKHMLHGRKYFAKASPTQKHTGFGRLTEQAQCTSVTIKTVFSKII